MGVDTQCERSEDTWLVAAGPEVAPGTLAKCSVPCCRDSRPQVRGDLSELLTPLVPTSPVPPHPPTWARGKEGLPPRTPSAAHSRPERPRAAPCRLHLGHAGGATRCCLQGLIQRTWDAHPPRSVLRPQGRTEHREMEARVRFGPDSASQAHG